MSHVNMAVDTWALRQPAGSGVRKGGRGFKSHIVYSIILFFGFFGTWGEGEGIATRVITSHSFLCTIKEPLLVWLLSNFICWSDKTRDGYEQVLQVLGLCTDQDKSLVVFRSKSRTYVRVLYGTDMWVRYVDAVRTVELRRRGAGMAWVDRRMDRWMDRWMNRLMDRCKPVGEIHVQVSRLKGNATSFAEGG